MLYNKKLENVLFAREIFKWGIHTELYIFLQAQLIRLSSTFVHDERFEMKVPLNLFL